MWPSREVICRSVGQISHSILPLPTQQWWVHGGQKLWLSGSSYLHTCIIRCVLKGDMRLFKLWVSDTREGNWLVEYGIVPNLKLCTFTLLLHSCTSFRGWVISGYSGMSSITALFIWSIHRFPIKSNYLLVGGSQWSGIEVVKYRPTHMFPLITL